MALSLLRSDARAGVKLSFADEDVEDFWKLLPFPPTNAQKRALYEMARDLRMDAPMARLLQGDVGSGKTAVAFGAMYLALEERLSGGADGAHGSARPAAL